MSSGQQSRHRCSGEEKIVIFADIRIPFPAVPVLTSFIILNVLSGLLNICYVENNIKNIVS
jgi:hypothetical protein